MIDSKVVALWRAAYLQAVRDYAIKQRTLNDMIDDRYYKCSDRSIDAQLMRCDYAQQKIIDLQKERPTSER